LIGQREQHHICCASLDLCEALKIAACYPEGLAHGLKIQIPKLLARVYQPLIHKGEVGSCVPHPPFATALIA
jgi:hypothetical protein